MTTNRSMALLSAIVSIHCGSERTAPLKTISRSNKKLNLINREEHEVGKSEVMYALLRVKI